MDQENRQGLGLRADSKRQAWIDFYGDCQFLSSADGLNRAAFGGSDLILRGSNWILVTSPVDSDFSAISGIFQWSLSFKFLRWFLEARFATLAP